ncbi:MAG: glycosyl transferase family 39, partial [Actinomadura sp.]
LRLLPRGRARAAVVITAAGLAGALAGPAAYALDAASSPTNGVNPTAGPGSAGMGGPGGGMPPSGGRPPQGGSGFGRPGASGGGRATGQGMGGGPGDMVDAKLISYLQQHQDGATWLVAVGSAQPASSIILRTGAPAIAMGGFTGSDPAMTVATLQQYVKDGRLRYVLTGDRMGPGEGASGVTGWVRRNCTAVTASEYGGTPSAQVLYRCTAS